jgi:hypothetical protein
MLFMDQINIEVELLRFEMREIELLGIAAGRTGKVPTKWSKEAYLEEGSECANAKKYMDQVTNVRG